MASAYVLCPSTRTLDNFGAKRRRSRVRRFRDYTRQYSFGVAEAEQGIGRRVRETQLGEKTKYSECSTPKLYRGLYINGSGAITDARSGTNTESEYRTEWHKESGMVWNVEIAIYGKHVNGEWFWNINKG